MEVCYNITGDIGVLESLFVITAKNGELMFAANAKSSRRIHLAL